MAVEAPEAIYGLQDWLMVNGGYNNNVDLTSGFDQVDHFPYAFQEQTQAAIGNNHNNNNTSLLLQQQSIIIDHSSRQGLVFDPDRVASSFSSSSCSSPASDSLNVILMSLTQSIETHLRMQNQEVARFLDFQSERLRRAFQEQREQQMSILVKAMESKVTSLARQKDEDLEIAKKGALELEACVNQAQRERDSWELLSREKDAMVIHLTKALHQAKCSLETACSSSNIGGGPFLVTAAATLEDQDENFQSRRMVCKSCLSRVSSVVFFPCRHLCSCQSCEPFLVTCPVCDSVKKSSMEVFLV